MRRTPAECLALVLDAAQALDARGVYPSFAAVAREARVDVKTAEYHLRALRASGELLVKTPLRTGGDGGRAFRERDSAGGRPKRTRETRHDAERKTPPPDIDDRVEHYAARLQHGWDLFKNSPFRATRD